MVLPSEFFARQSEEVARDLLGKLLVRKTSKNTRISGIISQVDAFVSPKDDVKIGKRNQGAFYHAGMIHMYPSQGLYSLAISTLTKDIYNEVLIRMVIPFSGLEEMRTYRGAVEDSRLADGPSKIVKAFNIDADFDGVQIYDGAKAGLWIEEHLKDVRFGRDTVIKNPSSDFSARYTMRQ